jgi:two-component system response regulator NreC
MARILIVDDHEVVLEGLRVALEKCDGVEVVGIASDGRDALKKVQSLHPEIVIMDIAMPRFNGIEATIQIKKFDQNIKIIVHTVHSYKEFLVDLMKSGISGYVPKQNPVSDLYHAIAVVNRGGIYLSEDASEFLAKHVHDLVEASESNDPFDLLSLREREVFQLLGEGLSPKEIGDILCISHKTVETHKYHIMDKLQIRSMTEWTKEAIRRGIIQV